MPGDLHQCRLNAAQCVALARLTKTPEAREAFAVMAATWKQIAAEAEAGEALLRVFSEMDFGEASEALPLLWDYSFSERDSTTPTLVRPDHGQENRAGHPFLSQPSITVSAAKSAINASAASGVELCNYAQRS